MRGWNLYQDKQNRAYSNILQALFPEQTKTLPRILVWSVIFLADLILVFAGAFSLGLFPSESKFSFLLGLAAVLGLFWLQGYLWKIVRNLFG